MGMGDGLSDEPRGAKLRADVDRFRAPFAAAGGG